MQAEEVQTDQEPKQESGEVDDAQDLDSILKEYDDQEAKPAPQPQKQPDDDVAYLKQFVEQQRVKEVQSAVSEAANSVKKAAGEAANHIPDYLIEDALHGEARRNPRIEKAFEDRFNNPQGWNKVVEALGKKIAKDLTPTDRKATESWDAVESAVHSSSTSQNTETAPPDFGKMSDAEFNKWKSENLR